MTHVGPARRELIFVFAEESPTKLISELFLGLIAAQPRGLLVMHVVAGKNDACKLQTMTSRCCGDGHANIHVYTAITLLKSMERQQRPLAGIRRCNQTYSIGFKMTTGTAMWPSTDKREKIKA